MKFWLKPQFTFCARIIVALVVLAVVGRGLQGVVRAEDGNDIDNACDPLIK